MPKTAQPITFDQLILRAVNQQMQAVEQGNPATSYISPQERKEMLIRLQEVCEVPEKPSHLFDRTSLTHISHLFHRADAFRERITQENHPARWIFDNPGEWFEQCYRWMYDPVAFLELIRYFGGGKNQHEKEIIFRSLVAKLIKTQETIRKIGNKKGFLDEYLEDYPKLKQNYPVYMQKSLKLSQPLSPADSVLRALKMLVKDISYSCLKLFEELEINLHESAQHALSKKHYYEALILGIRHAEEDLFSFLASEDYPVLVQHLTTIIENSLLHPKMYLLEHVKHKYMLDWLVHTLRNYDRQGTETFYQAGKSSEYARFSPLRMPVSTLKDLKTRKKLDDSQVIDAEIRSLESLSIHDFYELLLKIYKRYKDDHILGKDLPASAQALSSGGDITWDKKNMVAQVVRKVKAAEASGGADDARVNHFSSMLSSFRKIAETFGFAIKKRDKAIKAKKAPPPLPTTPAEEEEGDRAPSIPRDDAPRVMRVEHSGKLLPTWYPRPKRDVMNPVTGQRQDISFKDHDTDSVVAPTEQKYFVNFFNVKKEENNPINKNYNKFSNAIMAILRSYGDGVRHVQKKTSSGGNVDSFNEEILYLRIDEDIILVLGVTKMGQDKSIGKVPKGKTAYFRLFVKGSYTQKLFGSKDLLVIKEFEWEEEVSRFREVLIKHFTTAHELEAIVVKALINVVESLPQDQFDFLNDHTLIGFVSVLQHKAKSLLDNGLSREVFD